MNEETNNINEYAAGAAPTDGDLAAENESLRNMLRLRDARDELTASLKRAGSRSPSLLFAYAVDDLQFDEDGRLTNREAIVAKLRSAFPEQFGADVVRSVDGGAGTAQRAPSLTKETLARMSPTEIAKLDWAEVREVLGN